MVHLDLNIFGKALRCILLLYPSLLTSVADSMKKSLKQDALNFHATGRPGKLEIAPTKPLTTQRDLSLVYSPGVAEPCLAIEASPDKAYDYTAKGNLVAVISNGTAVLGLEHRRRRLKACDGR